MWNVRLRCVTLKCPYRDDWADIEHLTVGQVYEVEVLALSYNEALNQCEVTNDLGERVRVLQGHFRPTWEKCLCE